MTRAELCKALWRDYWYTRRTTVRIDRAYKVPSSIVNAILNNRKEMPADGKPNWQGGPAR